MKNYILLSALLIFACSCDGSDNSFNCNTVNSNLSVGSESSNLCDGLVRDDIAKINHITLHSNSSACFADNVPNNDAFIAFNQINSTVDGLEPGIYYLSGNSPAVGQFEYVHIKISGTYNHYYANTINGFLEIESVEYIPGGSVDVVLQWEFITNDGTVITGRYEGGLETCGDW